MERPIKISEKKAPKLNMVSIVDANGFWLFDCWEADSLEIIERINKGFEDGFMSGYNQEECLNDPEREAVSLSANYGPF